MGISNPKQNFIRVGSFNCQGMNDYYTRMTIFNELKQSNLEIICLQETKLKPEFENQYIKEWHNSKCIFNCTTGQKHGTAILINVEYITLLHNRMCDVDGRIIATDICMYGNIFHVVNSYGPNDSTLKIPFINRLYAYMSSNKNTIWCGDHNIATHPSLDRYPIRFSRDQGANEILELIDTFDLKDTCRILYPNRKLYTFRRGSSKSRIDKICCSAEFQVDKYEFKDTSLSDHFMISSVLFFSL